MFKYYIAYTHPDGVGCVDVTTESSLNTTESIKKLANEIAKENGIEIVIITFIRELKFE